MSWKLNDSNFNWLDRLKLAAFVLNSRNFWTMSNQVLNFEKKMADYVGSKHSVFVSSGSTANTILAMYLRDKFYTPKKNIVVFPSTTWTTSVAPFIREGFEPVFIDVNLTDFSIDIDQLEYYLFENSHRVCCVFVTSLIGFVPDMPKLERLSKRYGVRIMMDNCENTFGKYNNLNISSFFTSTTSTYFGHQLQSVEGGFIFTNSDEELDYYLMARNHGLTRAARNPENFRNNDIDGRFDFNFWGNNYRNTDINAFIGQLDFDRIDLLEKRRVELYKLFHNTLDNNMFLPSIGGKFKHVPFCLPVFCKSKESKAAAIRYCNSQGIENRPIISGNLLRQTCYKQFGRADRFSNSEFIHNNAFYVGLHYKVKEKDIINLVKWLNDNKI